MALQGTSVFARQQELADAIEATRILIQSIVDQPAGLDLDQPLIPDNPLFSWLNVRVALLVTAGAATGGALVSLINTMLPTGSRVITNEELAQIIRSSGKPIVSNR